jgi:hypothetical protein
VTLSRKTGCGDKIDRSAVWNDLRLGFGRLANAKQFPFFLSRFGLHCIIPPE